MGDERPGGPIRIGDSEREDAIKRLGEHYEAGRLSAEEHAERIDPVSYTHLTLPTN